MLRVTLLFGVAALGAAAPHRIPLKKVVTARNEPLRDYPLRAESDSVTGPAPVKSWRLELRRSLGDSN